MAKKRVIQVPVDDELFDEIQGMSKTLNASQAQVMREAFVTYRRLVKERELDRQYLEGHGKKPEDTSFGEAQLGVLGEVLHKEKW